jgi:RHS repeat-associated protein
MGTPGNVANPMTSINSGAFSYLYDGMGRLAQLNVPFTVMSSGNPINGAGGDYLQHQYQANGWLAQTNGLLMGMAPASSTVTSYQYNPRGFLTSLQNYQQDGSTGGLTNSSTFTGMGYDAVGNRLALSASIPAVGSAPDASRSVSFAYDTAHSTPSQNRDVLTGEASAGSGSYAQNYTNNFGYDDAYNPTLFAYDGSPVPYSAVNADNQFSTSSLFSYDGDGNPTTYENYPYSFDPEDRLTSAPALNTSGVFTASYDGDGLRATKTAVPIGGGSTPVTTYFLYDGDTPVLEETGSGSTATITAVNVEAADGIRARYSQTLGSQFYAFTYDPQGSLTGSQYSGNTFTPGYSTSSFEAYGHRGGQIGNNGSLPSNQPPFEFGGQYGYYTDVETGLLCLTHRYYDPGTGKFINRDPIGYAGGQNLYGFADGNPVNEIDPNGTQQYGNQNLPPLDDGASSNPYMDYTRTGEAGEHPSTAAVLSGRVRSSKEAEAVPSIKPRIRSLRMQRGMVMIPGRSGRAIGEAGTAWEDAVRSASGGKSEQFAVEVDGITKEVQIDSVTDSEIIEAKDITVSRVDNFLNQSKKRQIKRTIKLAIEQKKLAVFWFKNEPLPGIREWIERYGGTVRVGL